MGRGLLQLYYSHGTRRGHPQATHQLERAVVEERHGLARAPKENRSRAVCRAWGVDQHSHLHAFVGFLPSKRFVLGLASAQSLLAILGPITVLFINSTKKTTTF